MANIKITELNGITKKASNDVLAIVDVSANETKKIAVEDLLDKNVELIAVTDTEPAECSYGDKYFNTTDNLIYTAIATDTWGEDGEEPISGILYIVYSEQASYSWNGTELISVGGGKEDIVIDDEEPTDPDVKLWIDTGEIASASSEITNSYSTSTGLGYSCNYVNNLHTYSTSEKRVGTWIDGKPLYRKTIVIEGVVKGEATTYNHGIQNVDTIFIDANSFYKYNGGTPLANMLNNYQDLDKQLVKTVVNPTYIEYYVGAYVVSGTTDGYITVYYTKTTD